MYVVSSHLLINQHGHPPDIFGLVSSLSYRPHTIHAATVKPIFHCDAKYLASGVGVGCQHFALEIPTCRYILALPNAKFCVFPNVNVFNFIDFMYLKHRKIVFYSL